MDRAPALPTNIRGRNPARSENTLLRVCFAFPRLPPNGVSLLVTVSAQSEKIFHRLETERVVA